MIGRPGWFKRRKYGGWGIIPKTWQGWVYLALVLLPFAIFQAIPIWDATTRIIVTIVWIIFLVFDTLDIMFRMKRDEREKIHEAIAERNALWIMVVILAVGVAYQAAYSALSQQFRVDPVIIIALIAGLIVKAISNFYLERNN